MSLQSIHNLLHPGLPSSILGEFKDLCFELQHNAYKLSSETIDLLLTLLSNYKLSTGYILTGGLALSSGECFVPQHCLVGHISQLTEAIPLNSEDPGYTALK